MRVFIPKYKALTAFVCTLFYLPWASAFNLIAQQQGSGLDKFRDLFRSAQTSYNQRDWDLCVTLCDSALVYKPEDVRAKNLRQSALSEWTTKAHAYFNDNDYSGALDEYENILKHDEKDLNVIKRAVECSRIRGLNEKELQLLSRWAALAPEDFEAHNQLGQYYDRWKKWEAAAKEYEKALAIKPSAKLTHDNLEGCKRNSLNIQRWRQQIDHLISKQNWLGTKLYADSILSLSQGETEIEKVKEKAEYNLLVAKIGKAISEKSFSLAEELLGELGKHSTATKEIINSYRTKIAKNKIERAGYPELYFTEIPDTTNQSQIVVRLQYRLQAPLLRISLRLNDKPLDQNQYQMQPPGANRPGEIRLSLTLNSYHNQIEAYILDNQRRDSQVTKNFVYAGKTSSYDVTPPVITLIEPADSTWKRGSARNVKAIAETSGEIILGGFVTDDVGVASLSINGKETILEGNLMKRSFKFSEMIRSDVDTLRFVFLAKDIAGNIASQTLEMAITSEPEIRRGMGKTWAVLIANSAYKYWPDLQGEPYNDVAKFKNALSLYRIDSIIVKKDLKMNEFEPFLETIDDAILKENVASILFYYAGHGEYNERLDRGYWIPVDAEMDRSRLGYVDDQKIRDYLKLYNKQAKHVLLIADCCFSGNMLSFRSSAEIVKPTEADLYNLKKDVAKKSAFGITSGRKEERVANESLFSKALVDVLTRNRKLYLRDEDIAYEVTKRVREVLRQQQPQSGPIAETHDYGKFLFIKKTSTTKE